MAYEINPYAIKITLVAAADLSTKQYAFVRIDSTGKAAACTAVTDRPDASSNPSTYIPVSTSNPASVSHAVLRCIATTGTPAVIHS